MTLVYPARLLDTKTLNFVNGNHERKYAILSHRWHDSDGQEELTFRHLVDKDLYANFADKYDVSRTKHINACKQAAKDGWKYLWADTVCINKDSSEELRRSLNAMFEYYRQAEVCYTYLNDVDARDGSFMSTDPQRKGMTSVWFTRGWTLQELLAPRRMEFFDQQWNRIGERADRSITAQISDITNIDARYLGGDMSKMNEASVATKLSWMAGRVTGVVEDIAYSLIGLLGVSMTPQYGEGTQAFQSLQIALFSAGNSFDESLFAWETSGKLENYYGRTFDKQQWGLLAPSPDCFKASGSLQKHEISPRRGRGFDWNNRGVSISLPWKETRSLLGTEKKKISFGLNCKDGSDQVVVELVKVSEGGRVVWKRSNCVELGSRTPKKITGKSLGIDQGSGAYEEITIAQPIYNPNE